MTAYIHQDPGKFRTRQPTAHGAPVRARLAMLLIRSASVRWAMPARRPRCEGVAADQLTVRRGVICANQKSARRRSPASNCACEISASPLRSLRRRSHARGLSAIVDSRRARRRRALGACSGHIATQEESDRLSVDRIAKERTAHSSRSRARSNTGSSRRSSITVQACATVVRSRPKSRPVSVSDRRQATWARYIATWRANAIRARPRVLRCRSS